MRSIAGTKLLLAAICLSGVVSTNAPNAVALSPTDSMKVSVIERSRPKFLQRLEAFADRYGFAIDIAATAPSGAEYRAFLWTTDLHIVAVNPWEFSNFEIFFYQLRPGSLEQLQSAKFNLACMLGEVDGVTLVEDATPSFAKPAAPCP